MIPPHIDDHTIEIHASPDRVWRALLATLGKSFGRLPALLAATWGLQQRTRTGDWKDTVGVGDTVVGFAAARVEPPHVLTLRGRHRFAEYELRFELQPRTAGGTRLQATTSATFPGLKGRAYRTLVLGTGGHRIAVRRILARVARRAEREV